MTDHGIPLRHIDNERPPPTLDDHRQTIANGLRATMELALESDDPATVARCLASLRDFRQDAATIMHDIERHLLSCMGER
jgi:hypothetical protein